MLYFFAILAGLSTGAALYMYFEPQWNKSTPEQKRCAQCKHRSPAHAGVYWDRCHHPEVKHLVKITITGPGTSMAELPRCKEMREFGNYCGTKAALFEQRSPNDKLPDFKIPKDLHHPDDIPVIPVQVIHKSSDDLKLH